MFSTLKTPPPRYCTVPFFPYHISLYFPVVFELATTYWVCVFGWETAKEMLLIWQAEKYLRGARGKKKTSRGG